ncbi:hypothetical protein COCSUDRAFT_58657 [Coccomyxa subellipsoidea C-169]|uniref:Uncharacterized protein n=1 Tax=Coccomyxa subellipsoidea (strain C-169) TaxID=574566 RepID=I0YLU8_COCSC|nr:hypothetical protein COCSUDRAFT_58657 [Coccomyxa subellipsoidea C-169]EIE19367.1 hypothetical protein COCSUDRAFT_58657 [Coccomyxa subellipsoidea C-169]|eukprot:XP_005643911.1 hypothetical protein COCSUDRAFT_58657 [Coccomyxa subellipsoidea C-169]
MIPSLFNDLADKMLFVHKALELTSALSLDIFEMQPCTTLYFLLGPSALRPVEIYALSCSATAHVAAEPDDRCAEVARDISRKVLRSLIINTAAVPEGKASAGTTKLFLLLQAPQQEAPPPGFMPKRAFQLKQRRGLQVQIQLGTPQTDASAAETCEATASATIDLEHSTADGGSVVKDRELVWYQCTTSLKSLTTVSSNPTGISDFM